MKELMYRYNWVMWTIVVVGAIYHHLF